MVDAKDIDTLAMALREHREQLRVQEVAHDLATQFFRTAGTESTDDFRWRVIATMVSEVALRELGFPKATRAANHSERKGWRWRLS